MADKAEQFVGGERVEERRRDAAVGSNREAEEKIASAKPSRGRIQKKRKKKKRR